MEPSHRLAVDEIHELGVPLRETNSVFALVHSWFLPATPANTSHLYRNKRCIPTYQGLANYNHVLYPYGHQLQGAAAGGQHLRPPEAAAVTGAAAETAPPPGASGVTLTPPRTPTGDSVTTPPGGKAETVSIVEAVHAPAPSGPQLESGGLSSAAVPATPEQGSRGPPGGPLRHSAREPLRPHLVNRLAASLAATGIDPWEPLHSQSQSLSNSDGEDIHAGTVSDNSCGDGDNGSGMRDSSHSRRGSQGGGGSDILSPGPSGTSPRGTPQLLATAESAPPPPVVGFEQCSTPPPPEPSPLPTSSCASAAGCEDAPADNWECGRQGPHAGGRPEESAASACEGFAANTPDPSRLPPSFRLCGLSELAATGGNSGASADVRSEAIGSQVIEHQHQRQGEVAACGVRCNRTDAEGSAQTREAGPGGHGAGRGGSAAAEEDEEKDEEEEKASSTARQSADINTSTCASASGLAAGTGISLVDSAAACVCGEGSALASPLGAGPRSETRATLPSSRLQPQPQQKAWQQQQEGVQHPDPDPPAPQTQPLYDLPLSNQSQLAELERLRSDYAVLQRRHEALRDAYSAQAVQRAGVVRRQEVALLALREQCVALQSRTREVLGRMQEGLVPISVGAGPGAAAAEPDVDEAESAPLAGSEAGAGVRPARAAEAAGECVVCVAWRGVVERAVGLHPLPPASGDRARVKVLRSGCGCSGIGAAVPGRAQSRGPVGGQPSPRPLAVAQQQLSQRQPPSPSTPRRPSPSPGCARVDLSQARAGASRGPNPGASGLHGSNSQRAPAGRMAAAEALWASRHAAATAKVGGCTGAAIGLAAVRDSPLAYDQEGWGI